MNNRNLIKKFLNIPRNNNNINKLLRMRSATKTSVKGPSLRWVFHTPTEKKAAQKNYKKLLETARKFKKQINGMKNINNNVALVDVRAANGYRSYAKGGIVNRTGLARVHRGELVIPRAKVGMVLRALSARDTKQRPSPKARSGKRRSKAKTVSMCPKSKSRSGIRRKPITHTAQKIVRGYNNRLLLNLPNHRNNRRSPTL